MRQSLGKPKMGDERRGTMHDFGTMSSIARFEQNGSKWEWKDNSFSREA